MRNWVFQLGGFVMLAGSAFGQPLFTGADAPFQIGYAANLNVGDSIINLTNDGAIANQTLGSTFVASGVGNICVNAYVFDPQEEEIACCSCLVTPNGLNSLSVKNDLIGNTLTPAVPTSVVIKLTASFPSNVANADTACNPATAGTNIANPLTPGMIAWGSTLAPAATPGTYGPINVPFIPGTIGSGYLCNAFFSAPGCAITALSAAPVNGSELFALTQLCNFIQANGTGFGICKSCRLGALGGAKQ